MDFIICWEENPERFRMYKYTTFDVDEIKKILLCHRKLINLSDYTAEEEEALNYLNCKLMARTWKETRYLNQWSRSLIQAKKLQKFGFLVTTSSLQQDS